MVDEGEERAIARICDRPEEGPELALGQVPRQVLVRREWRHKGEVKGGRRAAARLSRKARSAWRWPESPCSGTELAGGMGRRERVGGRSRAIRRDGYKRV